MMMQIFPEATETFLLPGPAGDLEVITATPKQVTEDITVVICHPDPLNEGTMHNKVVFTLAKAFSNLGYRTVRFNFRGVGKSEGTYGDLLGECEDLKTVMQWVNDVRPSDQIWLAGFSFGAYISTRVATESPDVAQLISIAPATERFAFDGVPRVDCPWTIVVAGADEITPVEASRDWVATLDPKVVVHEIEGASHFFHGQLITLRNLLEA